MKHWHDTKRYDELVIERVNQMRSEEKSATNYCKHFVLMRTADGTRCLEKGETYFMHGRSGRTWLMCKTCCTHNVELELLTEPETTAVN